MINTQKKTIIKYDVQIKNQGDKSGDWNNQ
jgi:hypothetical protein